jgi:hypothetical protein
LQEVEEDLSGGITFKYLKKEVTEKKKWKLLDNTLKKVDKWVLEQLHTMTQ